MNESVIEWKAPSKASHPARDASIASYDAVRRKDKAAWLALFAVDGWIEDPVGRSVFDKDGTGHHGPDARSAFWDLTIAPVEHFVFEIKESFAAGNECANYATFHTTLANGYSAYTDMVVVYRVDEAGKIVSLRAIWEFDRTLATVRPPDTDHDGAA
jgi:ketosteroid isomerase-like protein